MKTLLLPLLIGLVTAPLFGLAQSSGSAETVESGKGLDALDERKISAELRFPKTSIMMGEPLAFEFVVHNTSDLSLLVEEGGDYRNALGRPDSFRVKVTDEEGKAVYQPPSGFMGGGVMGVQALPARGEKAFHLFLPHWAIFEHPGKVKIEVGREIVVRNGLAGSAEEKNRTWRLQVTAVAELTLLPADQEAFGKLINELGAKALEKKFDFGGNVTKTPLYHLAAIHDVRVVPWFLKLRKVEDTTCRFTAIRTLGIYDSPEAFEALREDLLSSRKTPVNFLSGEVGYLAFAIAASPYKEAWPFLQTQTDHPDPEVRRAIVSAIVNRDIPNDIAMPLLKQLTKDKDKVVRDEAILTLKARRRSLISEDARPHQPTAPAPVLDSQ